LPQSSASPDEDVQILRLSDQQQLHHFAIDPENPIDFLRFSPDASKLAIADVQGKVTVWTLDGSFLHEFQSLPRIKQMQFSPDSNQLAILDFEYYTSIYDLETTTSGDTELLRVRNGEAYKIHFSPDGQWLATVGDGITLWDLNGGQPIAFYEDPAGTIQGFGFSPDSRQFIATGVGMARIWRVETFDTLLSRGCAWIQDYLYNPLAPLSEAERRVCDGIEV
jgi:WD40 repeat protein